MVRWEHFNVDMQIDFRNIATTIFVSLIIEQFASKLVTLPDIWASVARMSGANMETLCTAQHYC